MSDIVAALSERRTLRRLPSRLRTPCRLTRVTAEGSWLATVRNVSGKGIGLIANRPVNPGMLLTVELPTKGAQAEPRLMRVTNSKPQPDPHYWQVGCEFIRELDRQELDALKARTPSIVPSRERRTAVRHITKLKTACKLVRVIEVGPWMATIRNISPRGISLIANRPFRQGMVLSVELPGRRGKYGKARLLKVSHARPQAGNKWWVLGGAFYTKLSKEELAGLV